MDRWTRLAGLALLCGLAGCGGASSSPEGQTPSRVEGTLSEDGADITLEVGGPAELQAILDKQRGRVVLVDFWATWCTVCRKQFPHTVALHRELQPAGLTTVSVACDDEGSHAGALAFLRKAGATFQNLRSPHGNGEETFDGFAIEGGALPHYKLFDRTGQLRYTFGADPTVEVPTGPEEIEQRVRELLAEPEAK